MGPPVRQCGVVPTVGFSGNVIETVWAAMWFGLRSYAYAGSVDWIGKTPVVPPTGRALPVMSRCVAFVVIDTFALGQVTVPCTLSLFEKSNVPLEWIHGPSAPAPPVCTLVLHRRIQPFCGVVAVRW